MINITELHKISGPCPTEFLGITQEGESLYFRYKWADLSVRKAYNVIPSQNKNQQLNAAIDGEEIYSKKYFSGKVHHNQIDSDELIHVISDKFKYSN